MSAGRRRHVWVMPPNVPVEAPGLVLEWRADDGGEWSALVTYIDKQGRVVTEWVTADRLRPVPDGG